MLAVGLIKVVAVCLVLGWVGGEKNTSQSLETGQDMGRLGSY